MTGCLSLVLLLFSLHAHSGSVEFTQWLPWDFIRKEILPSQLGTTETGLKAVSLGDIHTTIPYQIDITSRLVAFESSGEKISSTHKVNGRILFGALNVDQFITRSINGNSFRVHVKVECAPFHINLTRMEAGGYFSFFPRENFWYPMLDALDLVIPEWSMGDIYCTGASGVAEEIKVYLTKLLKDPAQMKPQLQQLIQATIEDYFDENWKKLSSLSPDSRITSMGRPSEKGVMLHGNFKISGRKTIKKNEIDETDLSSGTPQLVLSKEAFAGLLEDKINSSIPQNFNLQRVDGFRKLMSSRTIQFFIWPDLRNFSKNQPFTFFTVPESSRLFLEEKGKGIFEVWYNTNASLMTEIGGSSIEYLQLGLGLKTTLQVTVDQGKINLKSGKASLNLAWAWGALYQTLFLPRNKIDAALIKESVTPLFQNKETSENLPSLFVNQEERKLHHLRIQKRIVTLDWP